MVGFLLKDFVALAKKGGVIDDSTDKPMEFGAVLGLCQLHNRAFGVLLNRNNYPICEAYMGPDKLLHCSEWHVSGMVLKHKMYEARGIESFNATVAVNGKRIYKVMLLNGEVIKISHTK